MFRETGRRITLCHYGPKEIGIPHAAKQCKNFVQIRNNGIGGIDLKATIVFFQSTSFLTIFGTDCIFHRQGTNFIGLLFRRLI
jgi:hypothetical protein